MYKQPQFAFLIYFLIKSLILFAELFLRLIRLMYADLILANK